MKLDTGERNSAVWQKIEAYYLERLQMLRVKNDGDLIKLSAIETAVLRGKIKEAKTLLDLGQEPESIVID